MSRRIVVLAAVACATLTTATAAQSTDSLRQRVSELRRLWEEADRAASAAESLAAARETTESIREGVFDVTLVGELPQARAATAFAWREVEATLGERARGVAPVPFTVTVLNATNAIIRTGSGRSTMGFGVRASMTAEEVGRKLISALYTEIGADASRAVRDWAGGNLVAGVSRAELRRAYEDLVTTPHHAAGPCLLGDLGACRTLLGLQPSADPLTTWYDASDRYAAVVRLDRPHERIRPDAAAAYDRCAVNRDDASCVTLLRTAWNTPQPGAPHSLRNVLVRIALQRGGVGSYARLVDSEGEMADRLVSVAGESLDELLTHWLDALHPAAGSTPASVPVWTGALVWILAFSGLALRSSRWK